MGRVFVPFGPWLPDMGDLGNPNMFSVANVVPYGGNYLSIFPRSRKTAALSASGFITGFSVNPMADTKSGWQVYFGDNDALWLVDPDNWSVTEVSGATYSAPGAFGWQMTSFGQHQVACSGNPNPVQYRENGSGNFKDLITSTQKPRFSFVVPLNSTFQLLGVGVGSTGVTEGSGDDVVWYSDVDDIQTFLAAGLLSDYIQFPDDYGGFTAAIGGLEFGALLFKKGSIVMFDNTGLNGPEMRTIWNDDGCIDPNSVFRRGSRVYFWSTSGHPCYWDGSRVIRISENVCLRSLTDPYWIDAGFSNVFERTTNWQVHGVHDKITGLMHFSYRSDDNAGNDLCDRILHINVESEQHLLSISNVRLASGETLNKNGRIEAMVSIPSGNRPGQTFSPLSNFSPSPEVLYISEFDSSRYIYIQEAVGVEVWDQFPVFMTGFLTHPEFNEGSWEPTGIRPIVSVGDLNVKLPSWRVTVNSKNLPWDYSSSSTYVTNTVASGSEDREGFLGFPASSRPPSRFLHQFKLQFDIEDYDGEDSVARMISHFRGFEIRYTDLVGKKQ